MSPWKAAYGDHPAVVANSVQLAGNGTAIFGVYRNGCSSAAFGDVDREILEKVVLNDEC